MLSQSTPTAGPCSQWYSAPRIRGRPQMRCCNWPGQGGSPHHGLSKSMSRNPLLGPAGVPDSTRPPVPLPLVRPSARPRLAHFPSSWWTLVVACRLMAGRCLGRPLPCALRVRGLCVWCLGPLPLSLPPSHSTRRVCFCLCVVVSLCWTRARRLHLQVGNRNSSGTVCSLPVFRLASPLHSSATRQFVRTAPDWTLDLIHPEDHHQPMPGARRRIVCPVKHLPRST